MAAAPTPSGGVMVAQHRASAFPFGQCCAEHGALVQILEQLPTGWWRVQVVDDALPVPATPGDPGSRMGGEHALHGAYGGDTLTSMPCLVQTPAGDLGIVPAGKIRVNPGASELRHSQSLQQCHSMDSRFLGRSSGNVMAGIQRKKEQADRLRQQAGYGGDTAVAAAASATRAVSGTRPPRAAAAPPLPPVAGLSRMQQIARKKADAGAVAAQSASTADVHLQLPPPPALGAVGAAAGDPAEGVARHLPERPVPCARRFYNRVLIGALPPPKHMTHHPLLHPRFAGHPLSCECGKLGALRHRHPPPVPVTNTLSVRTTPLTRVAAAAAAAAAAHDECPLACLGLQRWRASSSRCGRSTARCTRW
jgi:hypothetical protein